MKKTLLALVAVLAIQPLSVSAEEDIKVLIDGEELVTDTAPIMMNNRVLVPFRAIFEKLGVDVYWDEETKTVNAFGKDTIMLLQVDNNKLFKNSEEIELDVAPTIVNNRTMVPVRVVAEGFSADVEWNGETREVTVTLK